jgi:DNA repair exonuclease SbcCD ATPase subunit
VIARLTLRDFRCYQSAELRPDRINVVVGPNGAGKSSLRLALEYALTGRAMGVTDEAGRGAEWLIRAGAKEAVVEVDLPAAGVLRRTIRRGAPNRVELEGVEGGTEAVESTLWMALDCDRDALAIACNLHRFLDLSPAEQQALLWAASAWTCTDTSLREGLGPGVPDRALALCGGAPPGGPEALDVLEQRAREARRDAKKRLQELEAEVARLSGTSALPPGVTRADRPRVEEQLRRLQAERDTKQRLVGAAESSARLREIARQRRERLLAEQAELVAELARLGGPAHDVERLRERLAEVEEEHRTTADELSAARGRLALAVSQVARLRAATVGDSGPGQCPWAPCPYPCDGDHAAAGEALESARAAAEAEEREAREAVARAEARARGVEERLATLRKEVQEAERAQLRRREVEERLARVREALREAEQEAAGAADTGDPEALRREIAVLDERLARGRQLLAALDAADRAATELAEAQRRAQDARADVEALEALVAALGPAGAKNRLLRELCDRLEAEANRSLDTLGAPAARLATEGRFGVEVRVGAWAPVAVLSRSERLRVGAALQAALCGLLRVPLLVIDDADGLTPAGRSRLIRWLLGHPLLAGGGQAWVLAVEGDVPVRDPGIPGVAVWRVDGGRIERVGQQEVGVA